MGASKRRGGTMMYCVLVQHLVICVKEALSLIFFHPALPACFWRVTWSYTAEGGPTRHGDMRPRHDTPYTHRIHTVYMTKAHTCEQVQCEFGLSRGHASSSARVSGEGCLTPCISISQGGAECKGKGKGGATCEGKGEGVGEVANPINKALQPHIEGGLTGKAQLRGVCGLVLHEQHGALEEALTVATLIHVGRMLPIYHIKRGDACAWGGGHAEP